TFIIGTFKRRIRKGKEKSYIYSSNPKFPVHAIVKKEIAGVEEGMIVYASLSYVGTAVEAEILEIIGHKDDPGIEISQIALEYGFQTEFPKEVYDEIHQIPEEVLTTEIQGRKDFRNRLIITIDGEDSKDFDDAIDITKDEDGNYQLGVYIADVSHYVKENSPLDKEALKRGTSVYLADRVIPMLPHKLSNGICSLNEGVDRLVLACLMKISPKGNLLEYDICEGVICSKHRMTYPKVNALLHQEPAMLASYPDLIEPIHMMQELSQILRRKRQKMGALEFDITEYKFKLDEQGKPISIKPIQRDVAELLIEDFMLLANETIAYHLSIMNFPCVYRIHEKPDQEKLSQTLEELSTIGVEFPLNKKKISPLDLQKLIRGMNQFSHPEIYHQLLLRSMMKARYSETCLGHYGLAMQYYCHFTSPIRRYPDLMVHRIIKEVLLHPKHLEEQIKHYTTILPSIATKSSVLERKSIDCERDVNDMLSAWYMEDNLRKEFIGIITSLT
ncbi:MAG: VacB/RNase II family 3'-5' exoribonuclease, partial [Anaeroplasmataceae bacterium]|nr:VacB/RNase II family 3'-5' exoribonuclease [Anaeroplasmataceae bacterium]